MITAFAVLASLVSLLVSSVNWRNGLLLILLIGVLQDPFRKLTPGIPAYYVLWAAAMFGWVFWIAWQKRSLGRLGYLALGDRQLSAYGKLFGLLLLLHAVHALVRWGNPVIPVLGVVMYAAPVVGLWVGMAYARNENDVKRFLKLYAVVYTLAALTVYLSPDYRAAYPVLQEIGAFVGQELRIYDVGTVLHSYSGVFRVGEIAGWHAASAATFWIILAVRNPNIAFRILAAVLVVALVGVIVLTGRRKMLMALSLFIVMFVGLAVLIRGGGGRVFVLMLLLGIVGSFGLQLLERDAHSSLYMERGVTVFASVGDRLETTTNLLRSAIWRSQGVGLGLGVASQGARHAGGSTATVGGAGEAGMGKIVLEIGLPGFVLLLLLLWRLARRVWRLLLSMGGEVQAVQIYGAAFSAFLLANLATFAVASQLFGDPLILLINGLVAGMLFRMLWESMARSRRAPGPASVAGAELAHA